MCTIYSFSFINFLIFCVKFAFNNEKKNNNILKFVTKLNNVKKGLRKFKRIYLIYIYNLLKNVSSGQAYTHQRTLMVDSYFLFVLIG